MTQLVPVQGPALARVGFVGWGRESARAWQALAQVEDAACWAPAPSSDAPAPPSDIRPVGSIEALLTSAHVLFLEGRPTQMQPALHTLRLAMSDRHLLAVLGADWRVQPLLQDLQDRKVLRCLFLSAGQAHSAGQTQSVGHGGEAPASGGEAGNSAVAGYSAVAVHAAHTVSPAERDGFKALFRNPAQVVMLREEAQFDVMQALGGFAPAAFLTVLDSMADGVRMLGVPRADAVRLLSGLLLDEVATVLGGQRSLADLREDALGQDVAAAGLMALEVAGLRGHMMRAVHEAVRHARELARESDQ